MLPCDLGLRLRPQSAPAEQPQGSSAAGSSTANGRQGVLCLASSGMLSYVELLRDTPGSAAEKLWALQEHVEVLLASGVLAECTGVITVLSKAPEQLRQEVASKILGGGDVSQLADLLAMVRFLN
eukprot:gene21571-28566_t